MKSVHWILSWIQHNWMMRRQRIVFSFQQFICLPEFPDSFRLFYPVLLWFENVLSTFWISFRTFSNGVLRNAQLSIVIQCTEIKCCYLLLFCFLSLYLWTIAVGIVKYTIYGLYVHKKNCWKQWFTRKMFRLLFVCCWRRWHFIQILFLSLLFVLLLLLFTATAENYEYWLRCSMLSWLYFSIWSRNFYKISSIKCNDKF